MPGKWEGSTRKRTLPTNWRAIRKRVLHRDGGRCTWITNRQRCTEPARDVDHIDRRGGDDDSNLRSLCPWHHGRKSSAEGNASRRRLTTKRPREAHPGLIPKDPPKKLGKSRIWG